MSSQTLPESGPSARPGAPEYAPSELRPEEPSFARGVGLVGAMIAVFGFMVVVFNEAYGPRIVGKTWGWLAIFVGMAAMLYHAARDGDLQVRRTYGLVGVALIFLAGFVSAIPITTSVPVGEGAVPVREVGVLFLPYGAASLLVGLFFLLAAGRHETAPDWRRGLLAVLGLVGGFLAVYGLLRGVIQPDFLAGPGVLLALLGLAYLCAYVTFAGAAQGLGYQVAVGIGLLGVLAVLYAIGRSVVPSVFHIQAATFLVPSGLLMMGLGLLYAVMSLGLVSENRLVVLTRRELTSYFYSPVAYIVLFGMVLVSFANYFYFIVYRILPGAVEPIVQGYFFSLVPVVAVIFVVPALTMRLLSEEKQTGTYEVLMTAPVGETAVVLSKFLASLIYFMILWVPAGLFLIALRMEGARAFDYRPLLSFYLALAFSGAAFLAMGLFFSSLTRNQIVAAVLTFMGMTALLVFYVLYSVSEMPEAGNMVGPIWQKVFQHLGFPWLWGQALGGRLPVPDLILQGSVAAFFLFLTVKVLEARKWG